MGTCVDIVSAIAACPILPVHIAGRMRTMLVRDCTALGPEVPPETRRQAVSDLSGREDTPVAGLMFAANRASGLHGDVTWHPYGWRSGPVEAAGEWSPYEFESEAVAESVSESEAAAESVSEAAAESEYQDDDFSASQKRARDRLMSFMTAKGIVRGVEHAPAHVPRYDCLVWYDKNHLRTLPRPADFAGVSGADDLVVTELYVREETRLKMAEILHTRECGITYLFGCLGMITRPFMCEDMECSFCLNPRSIPLKRMRLAGPGIDLTFSALDSGQSPNMDHCVCLLNSGVLWDGSVDDERWGGVLGPGSPRGPFALLTCLLLMWDMGTVVPVHAMFTRPHGADAMRDPMKPQWFLDGTAFPIAQGHTILTFDDDTVDWLASLDPRALRECVLQELEL